MRKIPSLLVFLLLGALATPLFAQSAPELKQQPALIQSHATEEAILAAARAGKRVVAVGDHGTVLLSDDGGRSFRQARAVPTRATLTSVSFIDANKGWAVGHWGTIIVTDDGGETWTLQRTDTSTDRPLFAVQALSPRHVVAVGLWSLVLRSEDGGDHWADIALPAPPDGRRADRNLFGLFESANTLYAPAERGLVLRSSDQGKSWSYLSTGYAGSLWTGVALDNGVLLVAGLRGTIYRSADQGATWHAVDSGTKSSITALTETRSGVFAVGLDGVVLRSTDGGSHFGTMPRDDRTALTAVIANTAGEPVTFSKRGVVSDLLPKPLATQATQPK
jgi:photosystem II stability/assembly factor-like uncharacterized protein